MIKLDEGFSGKGNALVNLKEVQAEILKMRTNIDTYCVYAKVVQALKKAQYFNETETWESFSRQISLIGAIFELFIEPEKSDLLATSPSVQVYIDLQGKVEIISSHEQILQDQHYIGE